MNEAAISRIPTNKFYEPTLDLFGDPLGEPRRVGRAGHVPTAEIRAHIRSLRAQREPRLSIVQIGQIVGLSRCTLFRHYADEIGSQSRAAFYRSEGQASGAARLPRGRPRHTPTSAQRRMVAAMHRAGDTQPKIADRLGITVPTLVLNYADELGSSSQRGARREQRDQKKETEIGRE
ncbi:hypothetical protein AAG614_03965 [Citromicrobium bathyomarinum]